MIEIADVFFFTQHREAILEAYVPLLYRAFVKENRKRLEAIAIDLHLGLADAPDTGSMAKVFDNQSSWSMFKNGSRYLWARHSQDANGHFTDVAHFEAGAARVALHCSEQQVQVRDGVTTIRTPLTHDLGRILLMYFLASRGGAIFHAAGAAIGGKGVLFPGKSGAGKSTLSRQFMAQPRPGIEPLSDDRMVVRKLDGAFHAFGTPWPGDAQIAVNKSAPLHSILFIHHGDTHKVVALSPQQAFERLMPVASIPWYDRDVVPPMLDFCEDLVNHVPAFAFHFRPTPDVAEFLQAFVQREM